MKFKWRKKYWLLATLLPIGLLAATPAFVACANPSTQNQQNTAANKNANSPAKPQKAGEITGTAFNPNAKPAAGTNPAALVAAQMVGDSKPANFTIPLTGSQWYYGVSPGSSNTQFLENQVFSRFTNTAIEAISMTVGGHATLQDVPFVVYNGIGYPEIDFNLVMYSPNNTDTATNQFQVVFNSNNSLIYGVNLSQFNNHSTPFLVQENQATIPNTGPYASPYAGPTAKLPIPVAFSWYIWRAIWNHANNNLAQALDGLTVPNLQPTQPAIPITTLARALQSAPTNNVGVLPSYPTDGPTTTLLNDLAAVVANNNTVNQQQTIANFFLFVKTDLSTVPWSVIALFAADGLDNPASGVFKGDTGLNGFAIANNSAGVVTTTAMADTLYNNYETMINKGVMTDHVNGGNVLIPLPASVVTSLKTAYPSSATANATAFYNYLITQNLWTWKQQNLVVSNNLTLEFWGNNTSQTLTNAALTAFMKQSTTFTAPSFNAGIVIKSIAPNGTTTAYTGTTATIAYNLESPSQLQNQLHNYPQTNDLSAVTTYDITTGKLVVGYDITTSTYAGLPLNVAMPAENAATQIFSLTDEGDN